MNGAIIQIFGLKKCAETRKAERWFKERGMKVQNVDLAAKGLSAGELRSVAAAVGGVSQLIHTESVRYAEKGLKHAAPSPQRIEAVLLEDPLLLRTPVVRRAREATVGFCPDTWKLWK